jgi:hypothetical protein
MFSLLLAVIGDGLRAAEQDRTRRALATRLGWTPEAAAQEGAAWTQMNPPDVPAEDLDWRYEPDYSTRSLRRFGWGDDVGDATAWLEDEIASRGLEWFRSFSRWYRKSPEEQPVVLVEDEHGELLGIWDGWHRSALAVAGGMKTVPAVVGRTRFARSVAGRQALAKKTYGLTQDPTSVGFILSNGEWIDFSEGQGGPRTMDHRAVTWLVPDDEKAVLAVRGEPERTLVMNHWMNQTHALRVSLSDNGYALLDFPDEPAAVLDLLDHLGGLVRWCRSARDFDVHYGGRTWSNVTRMELPRVFEAIREMADQAQAR